MSDMARSSVVHVQCQTSVGAFVVTMQSVCQRYEAASVLRQEVEPWVMSCLQQFIGFAVRMLLNLCLLEMRANIVDAHTDAPLMHERHTQQDALVASYGASTRTLATALI